MSYLKLTTDKIEQRLSYFKDKIWNDAKNKVKENITHQGTIGCFAFFVSLIVLGFSAIIAIADEVSALGHTIAFYIGVTSFITFTGSMLFVFFIAYLEYKEERYFKYIYEKLCKGYCEQYRVSNLEDDNNLRKILISFFRGRVFRQQNGCGDLSTSL